MYFKYLPSSLLIYIIFEDTNVEITFSLDNPPSWPKIQN